MFLCIYIYYSENNLLFRAAKLTFHLFAHAFYLVGGYLALGLFEVGDGVAREKEKLVVERTSLALGNVVKLFK